MRYAIGVGSNRGDRAGYHDRAADLLVADGCIQICARSDYLDNPAVGGPSGQGAFLNAVWIVETTLGAHQVLARLRRIEDQLGRVRVMANGPRTIDLDLLLAEDGSIYETAVLTLPHPRLAERLFVLEPLASVAAGWWHPILRMRVETLLWQLNATT